MAIARSRDPAVSVRALLARVSSNPTAVSTPTVPRSHKLSCGDVRPTGRGGGSEGAWATPLVPHCRDSSPDKPSSGFTNSLYRSPRSAAVARRAAPSRLPLGAEQIASRRLIGIMGSRAGCFRFSDPKVPVSPRQIYPRKDMGKWVRARASLCARSPTSAGRRRCFGYPCVPCGYDRCRMQDGVP